MDGTVPLHNMPPDVATFLYNIGPAEYGCQTRNGYAVWAGGLGNEIRTLIPFLGQVGDLSQARLFAVTSAGIYDVTSQGTSNPIAVVSFPIQTGDAGFCSFLSFTNPTGEQGLFVADGANGLYGYGPVSNTWTKYTTEITFPDTTTVNDIDFVTSHKGRIWLVARDKSDAYYLPVGAVSGVATKFQFGAKMRYGGFLVGLYSWSIDGGAGLDDYLVAISKSGDVIIYQGTDPSVASMWNTVGIWFIGPVPTQRRVAIGVGGDTILLSAYGITSATALLNGIDPTRVERNVTGKIARLVREAFKEKSDLNFWEVVSLPEEGLLIINSPKVSNEQNIQFVLNLNRVSEDQGGGWYLWRDVPATTFATHAKKTYFGTVGGDVCVMQGGLDNIDIDGAGGLPVTFAGMTGFTHLDAPAVYKQVQWVRAAFISQNLLKVAAAVTYDYDLRERNLLPIKTSAGGSLWDAVSSLWDKALWSGTFSVDSLIGTSGYGREFAIYFQGETNSRATLINFEGAYTRWKFL